MLSGEVCVAAVGTDGTETKYCGVLLGFSENIYCFVIF